MPELHGFIGPAYTSQSSAADAEDLANWYIELLESPGAKVRQAFYPTPGRAAFCDTKVVGGRALATMNGRTFATMGSTFGELFATQTYTSYGTVTQDSNLSQITFNGAIGNQALVCSGTNGYCLNLATNVLTQPLTGKATQVGMLDGYGIAFDASTGRIWISAVNDFTTWDPTQFAQRSTAPDTWKAMIVIPPDIWLIGSFSGDVWYDAGTFPFPFAPRAGFTFKYGIVAPFSLCASGSTGIWLSQNEQGAGIVVRTRGYQPGPISNYALETAISGYARTSSISDAEGFVYQDQGHSFYVLNFPSADRTWACDLDAPNPTLTWHRRSYWDAANNREQLWRPRVHTFAFGQHLTADRFTSTVANMDVTIGTELDGNAIRRVRQSPAIFDEKRQINLRVMEFLVETGLGTQTGQGANPMLMVSQSDDGGKTWGQEAQLSAGKVGQYQQRCRLWRNGVTRDRVVRLVATDPIPWRILGAYVNNDVPPNA